MSRTNLIKLSGFACCLVVIFCLNISVHADQIINLGNPVRSAAEDEIKNLPELNYTLNFKHYSGYLEADDVKNRFWHYWFVESQSSPDKDPLVLWLNGGPGCSSLLGLLTELGPYSISDEGVVTNNPFSWNKHANIIFLESPAGVGFSYAADGNVEANDDTTAQQNHRALVSFFEKFPQYKGRPLYLTGESYGGVYLPTLAVLVDADSSMNLKGVAIGNGYLDAHKLSESLIFFSYFHGLVGATTWRGLSRYCCNGKPPSRGQCSFFSTDRSTECAGHVSKAAEEILNSGLNPYNLYDRCAQPGDQERGLNLTSVNVGREHFDRSLMMRALDVNSDRFNMRKKRSSSARLFSVHEKIRGDPPCTDDSIVINYLNRDDVKKALHIPPGLKTPFTTCFDGIQYTMIYPEKRSGLAPQIRKLINSERDLSLVVYNGDTDMMCNFLGDEWFVDDLGLKIVQDYKPWRVNGQVAGFIKKFRGITYLTVKGSGHMVPTDRPAEALYLFENFLLN